MLQPAGIRLRSLERLDRLPCGDGLRHAGSWLRRAELRTEIDVASVRNSPERGHPTQSNVFRHEITIGDPHTACELRLPPTIETVARSRLSSISRCQFRGLSFQKLLGRTV